jgi:hypothetical protein
MNTPTPVQSENAELLDKTMNTILREGVTAIDPNTGEIVKLTPSAAMLNAIRGRIKDLGIHNQPVRGSAAGDLIKTAIEKGIKFNGRPIPPIDTDADDAATGS